jgi:solute carrier family 8 (sodium/calcium exchanger)
METMGCLLDLKPALQALTLVAIATSIPDAFTSYRASANVKTPADVAICNITASNAANIFIGLGLPWTIATVYHWSKTGDSYLIGKYQTAEIAFILALFLLASVIAILILLLRRVATGGELGGPAFSKYFSAAVLIIMWVIFVSLSSCHAYGKVGPFKVFEPDVVMNAA